MAKKNRIFTSFAIEDEAYRNLLVGQARNDKSPFEFVDMSVKEPWDEKWKTNCRTKLKGCDGVIAIVSKNTAKAAGALWEVSCAQEEQIPILGVYADAGNKPSALPSIFARVKVVEWTWASLKKFIDSL